MSKGERISGWRKIAGASWGHPDDPQIFGDLDVDATNLLAFIAASRAAGIRLTLTTLAGRAIAVALGAHPDLNVRLYRGRFIPRGSVDVFFIVSAEEGKELTGVKIDEADKKSAVAVARELEERAQRARTGTDEEIGKTKRMIARTPRRLLRGSIRATAWLTTDRNVDLKRYGMPRQPFGSAMVSSVGMFGIQRAYIPLANYYRVPFIILVGEVTDRAVVVDGEVVARPVLTLSATIDHRYLDGFHASRLAGSARAYLEDPSAFEPQIEP